MDNCDDLNSFQIKLEPTELIIKDEPMEVAIENSSLDIIYDENLPTLGIEHQLLNTQVEVVPSNCKIEMKVEEDHITPETPISEDTSKSKMNDFDPLVTKNKQQRNSLPPSDLLKSLQGQLGKTSESMIITNQVDVENGNKNEYLATVSSLIFDIDKKKEMIKKECKRKDISKLKEMFDAIKKYEDKNLDSRNLSDLRDTLITIGDLAGGENRILFNVKNDADSYYIRNKYGYIQRNKSNAKNDNGIYFEALYRLKLILENEDFLISTESLGLKLKPINFLSAFASKQKHLERDLSNLKQKIEYILYQERDFMISEIDELTQQIAILSLNTNNPSISSIIEFSKQHYEQIILKRIKEELDKFEDVDFSIREDRYNFARVFTVMGELLHEFTEDDENKTTGEKDILLNAFKNLVQIRSHLIHYHQNVWSGVKDKKEEQKINKIIIELRDDLKAVIEKDINNENNIQVNYTDTKTAQKLKSNSKTLLKIIKPTSSKIREQNQTIQTSEEREKEKLHSDTKKFIVQAFKAIETAEQTQKKPKVPLNDFLEKLDKKYQANLKKLDTSEQESYPSSLIGKKKEELANFSDTIKKTSEKTKEENKQQEEESKLEKKQLKKQELVSNTINKVNEEIRYLKEIEQKSGIKPIKKDYIIQHIVSVIGQYTRDIEEFDTDQFIPKISSTLVEESNISAKSARNQGLAHNIFSLDSKKLADKVQNDILPSHEHFQHIFTIYENHHCNIPISVITLSKIGASFLKLGLYYKAINYFKQTVERINTYPKEINEIKMSSIGISQEHGDVNVIDLGKELFGIEHYKFIAQKNLATAYLLAHYYDKAYEVLKSIIDKIDFYNLELANEDALTNFAEVLTNTASYVASHLGSYEEAVVLYEKAVVLYEKAVTFSDDPKIRICLAIYYSKLDQHDKAIKQLDHILSIKNLDPITKFYALDTYFTELSCTLNKQEVINVASKYINEMNSILENNVNYFKKELGDNYLLIQLTPIRLQVTVITGKAILTTEKQAFYNFLELQSELETLEKKCTAIINKLKHDLVHDKKTASIYTVFSRCFSIIIANQGSDYNHDMNNLKKAQDYFDQAIKIANSSQEILISAVDVLAMGYSNCALLHMKKAEVRIKFLERAFEIQEKYGTDKSTTLTNLGIEYHNLGESYFRRVNNYKRSFDEAFKNYNKTIFYLTQIITNSNTKLDTEKSIEFYKTLAMSYEVAGYLRYDIISIQKAILYYEEAIKQLKLISVPQEEILKKYQQKCKQKIYSIKNMFKLIQNKLKKKKKEEDIEIKLNASEVESYALSFHFKELPIRFEIRDKCCVIHLKGRSVIQEFKNRIQQELSVNKQETTLSDIGIMSRCDVSEQRS